MCGIAGLFGPRDRGDSRSMLQAMTRAIAHRGPDAEGHWFDAEAEIGLGHRRLSVIDLSEAGAQPMHSRSGRHVIVFNGEIYNFGDLRRDVERRRGRVAWRGRSDTEVLLELIDELGLLGALKQVDAMFALAVFDRQTRTLTLARDAFGEKPVYYGYCGKSLVFASELKAFEAVPGFSPAINEAALADYFTYAYVPAPASIFEGVFKLPAAGVLSIGPDDLARRNLPEPQKWWDMTGAARQARANPFTGDEAEALGAVRDVLAASTSRRMIADVPLGSLLSGGVDSSLVTALMQQASAGPVKTFSIGMDEAGYNEAAHAGAVARHLGTDHHELVLNPGEVQAVIPDVAAIHDEPFADSSQTPTFVVSRMARAHVTVALSGDGGDELFAGYNRHFQAPAIWANASRLPGPVRRSAAAMAGAIPPLAVDRAVAVAGSLAPRELRAGRAGEKIQKLARVLSAADRTAFHNKLLAATGDDGASLTTAARPQVLANRIGSAEDLAFSEYAMLTDTLNYLPDDILTKTDRASMAVALELRTPYLSRELFSLAWSLPMDMKAGGGQGKRILRDLLYTLVPREIVDRPKSGFAVPVGRWMRTGMREWAEAGLSASALADAGIFDVAVVRRRWAEHLSGRRDHESFLWSVLMYQGWRARARNHA